MVEGVEGIDCTYCWMMLVGTDRHQRRNLNSMEETRKVDSVEGDGGDLEKKIFGEARNCQQKGKGTRVTQGRRKRIY